MIIESTLSKLNEMKLTSMYEQYRRQIKDSSLSALSFDDRFGLLVDTEWSNRKNNRLRRLIHAAGFDQTQACIAGINYIPSRQLNRALIEKLSECNYIQEHHNIIIMGATGAGKSYLSCAFGISACQKFYTVKYIRLPDLMVEMAVARAEGTYKKIMKQYHKIDLLILDEWMLVQLKESEARDLLEIIHSRHHKSSTIFCSQFGVAGWHSKIGEATIADAILDRIVHDSYIIEIHSGENELSMREVYGINKKM